MSLYYVQKFLYELNRSEAAQSAYLADRAGALAGFELTDEEVAALIEPDVGLLFHLGVNGQILMHFAALHQIEWADYLQRMRDGIAKHGPVREGVYAMTGYEGVDAHAESLGQQSPEADRSASVHQRHADQAKAERASAASPEAERSASVDQRHADQAKAERASAASPEAERASAASPDKGT